MSQSGKMMKSKYIMPLLMGGTALMGYFTFKKIYGAKMYEGKEKLLAKTVIVTGANTGLGYEVAKDCATRGASVIMGCRDMKKCEEVKEKIIKETFNRQVKCKEVDMSSLKSIKKFASDINEEERFVDVLVNNAAIMRCPKTSTEDKLDLQLATNYLGPFLLTQLLLDKLKASGESRIVNVTSSSYAKGTINFEDLNSDSTYNPKDAYNQSKLALVMFTKELSRRLEGTKVTANVAQPEITRTGINRFTSLGQSFFSQVVLFPFIWIVSVKPPLGSQTIVYCVTNEAVGKETGKLYRNLKEYPIASVALDEAVSKRLWATSEVWTDLSSLKS